MRTTTYAVHIGQGATIIAKRTEEVGQKPRFEWVQPNYDQTIGRLTPETSISSFGDVTAESVATLADLTHLVECCKSREERLRDYIVSKTEALLLAVGNGRTFNPMRVLMQITEMQGNAKELVEIKINEVQELTAKLKK